MTMDKIIQLHDSRNAVRTQLHQELLTAEGNSIYSKIVVQKYDKLKILIQNIESIIHNGYSAQYKIQTLEDLLENDAVYQFKWEDWYNDFCNVFPNFNQRIEAHLPKHSIEDKKILSMLYIGYSSPEIADRLYMSPRSIETRKYRLIKKFKFKGIKELRELLSKI